MSSGIGLHLILQNPAKNTKKRNLKQSTSSSSSSSGSTCQITKYIPVDVFDQIFSYLPIKEAVQMKILSPEFRDSWRLCRYLNFGRDFARGKDTAEYVQIVNRVMELHSGSRIDALHLNLIPTGYEKTVENWIHKAIMKGLEELELNFTSDKAVLKLQSECFNIPSLKTLRLAYGGIEINSCTTGPRSLETIILRKVRLAPGFLEAVFQICEKLHTLDMTECAGLGLVTIQASNLSRFEVLKTGDCKDMWGIKIFSRSLKTFYYRGKFIFYEFEYAPQLTNVLMYLNNPRASTKYHGIGTLLDCLSWLYVLTVSSAVVEELSTRMTMHGYTCTFHFLKELQVIMEDARYCNLFDLACILNNCPRLEKLFLDMDGYNFEGGKFWTTNQKDAVYLKFKNKLNFLKVAKLKGFRFQEHEAELVKFLMERARNLESLILITPKSKAVEIRIPNAFACHGLFSMWKAPVTSIYVYEHLHDPSGVFPAHMKTWYSGYNILKEPLC